MTFDCYHDWEFRNVNWIEFTFIELSAEIENVTGMGELRFAFLGLHVRLLWVANRQRHKEFHADIDKRLSELESAE